MEIYFEWKKCLLYFYEDGEKKIKWRQNKSAETTPDKMSAPSGSLFSRTCCQKYPRTHAWLYSYTYIYTLTNTFGLLMFSLNYHHQPASSFYLFFFLSCFFSLSIDITKAKRARESLTIECQPRVYIWATYSSIYWTQK